jgi:hypothetical protein
MFRPSTRGASEPGRPARRAGRGARVTTTGDEGEAADLAIYRDGDQVVLEVDDLKMVLAPKQAAELAVSIISVAMGLPLGEVAAATLGPLRALAGLDGPEFEA